MSRKTGIYAQRQRMNKPKVQLKKPPEVAEEESVHAPPEAAQAAEALRETPSIAGQIAPAQRAQAVMHLQRTYGNQAVQRMLQRQEDEEELQMKPLIQRKLTVGPVNDPYEQEADRVAQQVMSMPATSEGADAQRQEDEDELQLKPLDGVQRQEDEEELQMKPLDGVQRQEDEEELQLKPLQRDAFGSSFRLNEDTENRLNDTRGQGDPLPDHVRGFMEPRFGADFGNVRVHSGAAAVQLSQDVQARAFTHGSDIYFNQGQYSPDSGSGQQLLAHELTHVIQQTGLQPLQPKALPDAENAEESAG
ncbi:MAG: DUF4157 domain-containing protein [Anaerolineae bacterium]|nr:DUF4157 domain-containing protein [Anaerolineae bacterium]